MVTRCKFEAAPDNAGVPQQVQALRLGEYFESHLKIALAPQDDSAALTALAQCHAAHLSRNALRRDEDGREQRFVTQRLSGAGVAQARAGMVALAAALAAAGHAPLRCELEFVVVDSNLGLAAGRRMMALRCLDGLFGAKAVPAPLRIMESEPPPQQTTFMDGPRERFEPLFWPAAPAADPAAGLPSARRR